MMNYNLPLGYRFCPTEGQLLTLFLRSKAMGLRPPQHGVIEKNLYTNEATPWIILNDTIDGWQVMVDSLGKVNPYKKVIYVVTKLSNVVENGPNKVRTAGCGKWHGSTAPKSILNSRRQVIGENRMFTYSSNSETIGHWNMDQYQLAGVALEGIVRNDYAICRIKKDESKSSKGGRLLAPRGKLIRSSASSSNDNDNRVAQDNKGISLASTSIANDKLDEDFAKRKTQFDVEEIDLRVNKRIRRNNVEGISNIEEASEVAVEVATASSSYTQNVVDGSAVNHIQENHSTPQFDVSEGMADDALLKDDDFFQWLNDMIDFDK